MSRVPAPLASAVTLLGMSLALSGCGLVNSTFVDSDRAQGAENLAFRVDSRGRLVRTEYRIATSDVPEKVCAAMDRLHPGDDYTGAEFEIRGRKTYYQLSRVVDGFRVESLFSDDGTLEEETLEIPAEKAPIAVRETVQERFPDAADPGFESLRDGQGQVKEYQVTLRLGDRTYRLSLSPEGQLARVWRELTAEVEVPVPLP